jgi:hypothetical protein
MWTAAIDPAAAGADHRRQDSPDAGREAVQLATEISQLQYEFEIPVEKLRLVDRLGYDAVFTSENVGSGLIIRSDHLEVFGPIKRAIDGD